MTTQTTYQVFYSSGNEPDFTQVNQMALDGWELAFFNGDVPPGGGTRQWFYVMAKKTQVAE